MQKEECDKTHALIQELVDNIPDVIYFKDKEGKLILVNKAHAAGLGLVPEEVIGKTDFDFFPLEQAKLMTKDDSVVVQTGLPVVDVIERTTQPDGSQHIVSTTKIPRKDEKGRVVGIMGITRDITERVSQEEERALERKKAAEELKKVKDKLELEKLKLEQILNIEEDLNKIMKLDELMDFVATKTSKILEAHRCSIMLVDKESKELQIRGYVGIERERINQFRSSDTDSVSHVISQLGCPILVTDIEQDKRFQKKKKSSYASKSFMSVPIQLGDELLGIINVADKKVNGTDVFSHLDLKILTMLARQVAVAIENANLYKELNFLTISDPMTNMYNYRYFAKSLDQELNRMKRYDETLSLLMIDIDDFKAYNDTFGHLEGDQLLREVSRVLHDNLRAIDIACRYAGDEFVVILPKTDVEQSKIIADKILKKIAELPLKKTISVSIGICPCIKEMDRHQLTLNADAALYKAKELGKNRVYCCDK